MKIGLMSDTHMEGRDGLAELYDLLPEEPVDVFMVAGDATSAQLVTDMCLKIRDKLQCPVLYTPGNHEYYYTRVLNCTMFELEERWREEFSQHEGIHFLQGDSVSIGDVSIFGTTWWSNFQGLGTDVMEESKAMANTIADFSMIKFREMTEKEAETEVARLNRLKGTDFSLIYFLRMQRATRMFHNITADDMIELNLKAVAAYKKWHKQTPDTKVLLSHFPMIKALQHGFYEPHPYFVSADDFFIDQYKPDLLLFGHTHYNHRLETRGLRCASNMLGYNSERAQAGFDRNLIIEI